jgi:hypothetical protein
MEFGCAAKPAGEGQLRPMARNPVFMIISGTIMPRHVVTSIGVGPILTVIFIMILILLLGLLTQIGFVSKIRQQMENAILRFIPSLNYFKLMADDKLKVDDSQNEWKPVLVLSGKKYSAGFIVEETELMITLFISKGTSLKEGEILTTNKKDVTIIPATYDQLNKFSRAFGKGFISIIEKGKEIS